MSYLLNLKWTKWYLAKDIEDAKKENDLEKVECLRNGRKLPPVSISKQYIVNFEDQSLYFSNLRSLSEYLVFHNVYNKEFSIDEIRENELVNITNDIFDNEYFIDYLEMRKENLECQMNDINYEIKELKEEIENLEEDYREAEINLYCINDYLNK